MSYNPQATELNEVIKNNSPTVYNLLSNRGKGIFFPKKGILAQTADAKGTKINATIGAAIEDDGNPMNLKSISSSVNLDIKDYIPYAPSFGRADLRTKWKDLIITKNECIDPNEISLPIVTCAITHALSIAGFLFIEEGDEIISPDLFWGNYKLVYEVTYGAKIVTFETFSSGKFNVNGLKEKLMSAGDKKTVLLNFPNNPTGYTPSEEIMGEIFNALEEAGKAGKNILVICDDAYFGLVYDDSAKESVFSKICSLHENILAVKVDGCTKEEYVWGLRVGFITFGIKNGSSEMYSCLESKSSGAVRGTVSNAPNISQSIVLKAFENSNYWTEKKEKYNLLKDRYTEVVSILEENKYKEYFTPLPFNSGYFMCIKMNVDPEKVRLKLLDRYSTGVISIDQVLRIAYSAVAKNNVKELFDNIYEACKEI